MRRHHTARQKAVVNYIISLDKAKNEFQDKGDLKGVKAVDSEAQRWANGVPAGAAAPDSPRELQVRINEFDALWARATRQQEIERLPAERALSTRFKQFESHYVRQGRIDAAESMEDLGTKLPDIAMELFPKPDGKKELAEKAVGPDPVRPKPNTPAPPPKPQGNPESSAEAIPAPAKTADAPRKTNPSKVKPTSVRAAFPPPKLLKQALVAWPLRRDQETPLSRMPTDLVPSPRHLLLLESPGGYNKQVATAIVIGEAGDTRIWGDSDWFGEFPRNLQVPKQVGVRYSHGVFLLPDGRLSGFGREPFALIPETCQESALAVASGNWFSVGLFSSGTVKCWRGTELIKTPLDGRSGFHAIAAGSHHAVALHKNGRVVAWDRHGKMIPAHSGQSGVVAVACGHDLTFTLHEDRLVRVRGEAAWKSALEALRDVRSLSGFPNAVVARTEDGRWHVFGPEVDAERWQRNSAGCTELIVSQSTAIGIRRR